MLFDKKPQTRPTRETQPTPEGQQPAGQTAPETKKQAMPTPPPSAQRRNVPKHAPGQSDSKKLQSLSRDELWELLLAERKRVDDLKRELDAARREAESLRGMLADVHAVTAASAQLNEAFAAYAAAIERAVSGMDGLEAPNGE